MKTYQVSHILVSHKFEAEDLLRKIKEGKSFSDLAIKYSKCGSASRGGDLGILPFGRAESDFEDAVRALGVGETTITPIRTRFGYHLIWRKK